MKKKQKLLVQLYITDPISIMGTNIYRTLIKEQLNKHINILSWKEYNRMSSFDHLKHFGIKIPPIRELPCFLLIQGNKISKYTLRRNSRGETIQSIVNRLYGRQIFGSIRKKVREVRSQQQYKPQSTRNGQEFDTYFEEEPDELSIQKEDSSMIDRSTEDMYNSIGGQFNFDKNGHLKTNKKFQEF